MIDFGHEPRNEATQEELRREPEDSVDEVLKFRKILRDGALLSQLEESASGVIVVGRSETSLEGLDERQSRSELTIIGHPLEPYEGSAIHIE